jgi:hypothetical protein
MKRNDADVTRRADEDEIAAWARHAAAANGFGGAGQESGAMMRKLRAKSRRLVEIERRDDSPRDRVIDRVIREHVVPAWW